MYDPTLYTHPSGSALALPDLAGGVVDVPAARPMPTQVALFVVAMPLVIIGYCWRALRAVSARFWWGFQLYVRVGAAMGAVVGVLCAVMIAATSGRSHGAGAVGSMGFLGIWVTWPFFLAREYAHVLYQDERVRPHVDNAVEAAQPLLGGAQEAGAWLWSMGGDLIGALASLLAA